MITHSANETRQPKEQGVKVGEGGSTKFEKRRGRQGLIQKEKVDSNVEKSAQISIVAKKTVAQR